MSIAETTSVTLQTRKFKTQRPGGMKGIKMDGIEKDKD